MAEIVLGLATSHTPQLSMTPNVWLVRGQETDTKRKNLFSPVDGSLLTYEDLLAQADPVIANEYLKPESLQARHEASQQGLAKIGEALDKASPDILIMFGDDQFEVYRNDNMPSIAVYWGDTILHDSHFGWPYDPKLKTDLWCFPEENIEYPVASDLGKHVIESLIDQEFDVAHSRSYKEGQGMSHAFSFVYWRVMDGVNVIPTLPIHINTYFPPNQPSPTRSYELGRAVRRAVESWDSKARVAVLGSGGLSHFVVDEDIDHRSIEAMKSKDVKQIAALPLERLNAGTSEVRNWLAAAGASENLDMEMFDYVPCYRSPAGTGCAVGFAQWT